ncbi:hypothetical protein F2Q69_00052124 [Brassica cretica]|uniref:Zinc finger GRF-type domain-containing protein n=1 Tax=Brassica cretica TaxID=69181 RepID=A0A8S9MYF9_BRACR|nr:hypothetical protein F2Q69_00052124 [Brassica cretica]
MKRVQGTRRVAISRATLSPGGFLVLIDDGVSSPLVQMDLSEERKHSKRQKDYINMLSYTCDSEYGIPRRCSCGGRIIDEVRVKQEYDTLPGKRFFTCANYEETFCNSPGAWDRVSSRLAISDVDGVTVM